MIQPYLKSTQILRCASYNGTEPVNYTAPDLYYNTTTYCGPWPDFYPQVNSACNSASRLADAAGTVWLLDSSSNDAGKYHFYQGDPSSTSPAVTTSDPRTYSGPGGSVPLERHLGTTNVLWCDGHVKTSKLDKLAVKKTIGADQIATAFTIADD